MSVLLYLVPVNTKKVELAWNRSFRSKSKIDTRPSSKVERRTKEADVEPDPLSVFPEDPLSWVKSGDPTISSSIPSPFTSTAARAAPKYSPVCLPETWKSRSYIDSILLSRPCVPSRFASLGRDWVRDYVRRCKLFLVDIVRIWELPMLHAFLVDFDTAS